VSNTAPALSTFLGGAIGRHARPGGLWFNPGAWAFLTLTLSWLALMMRQVPCLTQGDKFPRMCYSDITVLYYWRGLKDGQIPYLDSDVEYPVLTGGFMEFSRRILLMLGGQSRPGLSAAEVSQAAGLYFAINSVLLFALFVVLIWAHLKMHRPWDAMMIAAAPAVWTTGLINWDALVIALTSLALLAWSRKKPVWAGIWLGLGIAAKLYPVLLLVPLGVLCVRTGRWRPFFITLGATVASWVAVNLPVYLATPDGWMSFWTFNVDRGGDLGSIWYVLSMAEVDVPNVSKLVAALMVAGTLAICAMLLLAPRRPRLAQGMFLIVALFLMINKVYSPQYVLWLLPLLLLARPRWLDWAIFAAGEAIYFVAIWAHLDGILAMGSGQERLYWWAVYLRIGVQLWLCGRVVHDMFTPRRDIVRAGGLDDPDGGIFDQAHDMPWVVRLNQRLAVR
jgi:uncharacterized membrane protein